MRTDREIERLPPSCCRLLIQFLPSSFNYFPHHNWAVIGHTSCATCYIMRQQRFKCSKRHMKEGKVQPAREKMVFFVLSDVRRWNWAACGVRVRGDSPAPPGLLLLAPRSGVHPSPSAASPKSERTGKSKQLDNKKKRERRNITRAFVSVEGTREGTAWSDEFQTDASWIPVGGWTGLTAPRHKTP